MQILESSIIGLRSARYVLSSPDYQPTVTLFPMVHVGDESFFETVYRDALAHDFLLAEGVNSAVVKQLTRSYRWMAFDRLGLVLQPSIKGRSGRAQIIHADLSAREFEEAWARLPLWMRLVAPAYSTGVGLHRFLTMSRDRLVENRGMDELSSRDDLLGWSPDQEALMRVILDIRDERLCSVLLGLLEANREQDGTIAIVYGARHMRAVLRLLVQQGSFRVRKADWMPVIAL